MVGPAPISTQWTVLCLDLQEILNTYLNRRYAYIKSMRLCANLMIKNLFTSDTYYIPGLNEFPSTTVLLVLNWFISTIVSLILKISIL